MSSSDWYNFHRDNLNNYGYKRYSSGCYAVRNKRLVEMIKGFNFKTIVEVAGSEADLARRMLIAYPFITCYSWSDMVDDAVFRSIELIKDNRFMPYVLDLDYENVNDADLFVCTALEHTLRFREIVKDLLSGTLVLLSLPSFNSGGHRVHFPQFTDIINVYGEFLDFIKVEVFIMELSILSSGFITFKKCLDRIGLLDYFMNMGLSKKRFERDSLHYKWLIVGRRK